MNDYLSKVASPTKADFPSFEKDKVYTCMTHGHGHGVGIDCGSWGGGLGEGMQREKTWTTVIAQTIKYLNFKKKEKDKVLGIVQVNFPLNLMQLGRSGGKGFTEKPF